MVCHIMKVKIHESWNSVLSDEFAKPYFQELAGFVRNEYHSQLCFPPAKNIFSAFAFCQWLSIIVFKSVLLSARLGSGATAKQIAKILFLNIVIRYWRVSRAFLF